MAAFKQALEDGADILETDVHLSKDGVFMLIHDDTIDRTTNGTGAVADMTVEELRQFSASYGRAEFESERIPTLAELVEIIPEDCALALELKTDRFLELDVCKQLVAELREATIHNRTIILSFSADRLAKITEADPEMHTGWITLSKLKSIDAVQMVGPFWPLLLLNPFYVRRAHKRQQAVCPLDPNPDRRLRYYRWLGCDAVLTDDPGKTRRRLDKLARVKNRLRD